LDGPAGGAQPLHAGREARHLVDGQDARAWAVAGQQDERAGPRPHGGDARAKRAVVPDDLGACGLVRGEVAADVRRAHVQEAQRLERRRRRSGLGHAEETPRLHKKAPPQAYLRGPRRGRMAWGTPLSPTARKLLLLGSGELGKEVAIEA